MANYSRLRRILETLRKEMDREKHDIILLISRDLLLSPFYLLLAVNKYWCETINPNQGKRRVLRKAS